MITIVPGAGSIAPIPLEDTQFTVLVNYGTIDTEDSSSEANEDDMVIDQIVDGETSMEARILVSFPLGIEPRYQLDVASDDAEVISNNRISNTTQASIETTALVRARGVCRGLPISLSVNPSFDYNQFNRYAPGSLGLHITEQIDALAAVVGKSVNIYSTATAPTGPYVRNSNVWTKSSDLAGIMANRSSGSTHVGSVVVAPDIVTGSIHAMFGVGSTMRFVDSENVVHTRTLAESAAFGTDIVLWRLNEALPETVKRYKVLPSAWLDYLPSMPNRYGEGTGCILPIISVKRTRIVTRDWDGLLLDPENEFYRSCIHREPTNADRLQYSLATQLGDSGYPMFIIINGEPIWIGNHWGFASGAFISDLITEANAAIDSLGSESTLQTVDLSGFTNYG